MKATVWCAPYKVKVEDVPDPKLLSPRDAIVKISSTCICGSDLHLYDGFIPAMKPGDILGHEFMGEVVDVGSKVTNIKKGDRVIVPFCIACGDCFFCKRQLYSCCDNSNPKAYLPEKAYGFHTAGLFAYPHLTGAYAAAQAGSPTAPSPVAGRLKLPEASPHE